jgi:hypothetical protein
MDYRRRPPFRGASGPSPNGLQAFQSVLNAAFVGNRIGSTRRFDAFDRTSIGPYEHARKY